MLDEATAKDVYEIAFSAKKGEIDDATKDLNAAKAAVSSANAVIAELELTQVRYLGGCDTLLLVIHPTCFYMGELTCCALPYVHW